MKKVISQWLMPSAKNEVKAESLSALMEKYQFIGFVPTPDRSMRYFIAKGGDAKGLAIRHNSTWTSKEDQKVTPGTYYVFDSAKELYSWLAGE